MEKINAVITGVGGYVPDYVLTNDELSETSFETDADDEPREIDPRWNELKKILDNN